MSDFVWAMTQLRRTMPIEVERKETGLRLRRISTTAWTVRDGEAKEEYVPSKEDRAALDWRIV